MNTEKTTGRWMGAVLLLTLVLGLWNNFGLMGPILSGGGWLKTGAQLPMLFASSAMLGLFCSVMMLVLALLAWPVLRQRTPNLALAYLLLSTVVVATSAVEQGSFLAMRSLSLQYAKLPAADPAMFELLRSMVGASHHGIHYIDKLFGGLAMFVLFLALYRSRLLPRSILAAGLVAAPIQMTGIVSVLFMKNLSPLMLAPLAFMLLVLSLTLLVRGLSAAAPAGRP